MDKPFLNEVSNQSRTMVRPAVYLVEDDATERDLLALLLQKENIAVYSFQDAQTFLDLCRPDIRGCALLDERMPVMNGLTLQAEMMQRGYTLPVIFLSGYGTIQTVVQAIKGGAYNFLTKPIDSPTLIACVRTAMEQDERTIKDGTAKKAIASKLGLLTEREREILLLAIRGRTSKEIAQHLEISHRTVEIHRAHILQKTGASNLLELARIAGLYSR